MQPNTHDSNTLLWPVAAVLFVYLLGWLPTWAAATGVGMAAAWLWAPAAAWSLLGAKWWRDTHPARLFGEPITLAGQWLARLSGVAAGLWWWWSGTWSDPWSAAPFLALAGLVFGAWWAALSIRAPKAEQALVEAEQARWLEQHGGEDIALWQGILADAGVVDVVVTQVERTRGGYTLTASPVRREGRKAPTYSTWAMAARDVAVAADAALPDAMIREADVVPEKGSSASVFRMHVSTHRALIESQPYEPDLAPADIEAPKLLAYREDGGKLELVLFGVHYKMVAGTGGGKSVVANNVIGRLTACSNELVWVGAVSKLTGLVYPWLVAWLEGRTDRPLLDWVAGQKVAEVLRMLGAAYQLACLRNDHLGRESTHHPTAAAPAVTVILEEAARVLGRRETIKTHTGEVMNASALVAAIVEAGRSAGVQVFFMSQYGLFGAGGDYGSEMERNITGRMVGRTMRASDGTNTLPALPGNVDTTLLTDKTILVQPSIEEPTLLPVKAGHLEGLEMIDPLVVRQTPWRPAGLELEAAQALDAGGWGYSGRWQAERCETLVNLAARENLAWPGQLATVAPGLPDGPVDGPFMVVPTVADMPASPVVGTAVWVDQWDGDQANVPLYVFLGESADHEPRWGYSRVARDASLDGADRDWRGEFDDIMQHWDDHGGAAMTDTTTSTTTAALAGTDRPFAAAEDALAEFERLAAEIVADAPAPSSGLLGEVMAYLRTLDPAVDWVASSDLVVGLRRVPATASESELAGAAAQLGRELKALMPNLQPRQRTVGSGDEKARPRGYLVADLRGAAEELRRSQ